MAADRRRYRAGGPVLRPRYGRVLEGSSTKRLPLQSRCASPQSGENLSAPWPTIFTEQLPQQLSGGGRVQIPMKRPVLQLTALLAATFGNVLLAQSSLVLSSGTTAPGGPVSLNLTMTSPAGNQPAALQWTFTYSSAAMASFTVGAGPSLTAANKTIACSGNGSAYTCVAYGMNATPIADGIVATVSVTPAVGVSTVTIGASNGLGATPAGDAIAVTATGGVVNVISQPTLSAINCSPSTLTSNQASTCTVTLGAAAASTTNLALSSSAGCLAVPQSVSIAAGTNNARSEERREGE